MFKGSSDKVHGLNDKLYSLDHKLDSSGDKS